MDDELFALWPTHILRRKFPKHEECRDDLRRFVDDYMAEHPVSRSAVENKNLYESEYGIVPSFFGKSPAIRELTGFLCDSFIAAATAANDECWNASGIDRSKLRVKMTASWFINYLNSGYVKPHTHGNCSWSCVYYLQMGDVLDREDGGTYFASPEFPKDSDDLGNMYLQGSQWSCRAEEGYALFFPPLLSHGSFPYTGNTNRIIFSANAQIISVD